MGKFKVAEFCVGGGGQALGLEAAGFNSVVAVEIDGNCCTTLRLNRPQWNVIHEDMRLIDGTRWPNVDLFAAGVPCPPFSIAGKQLGNDDDRDMFPDALRLIGEMKPKAVMLENVPGFATAKFAPYREKLFAKFGALGYETEWKVLQAADYGVPQLRPRFILVALRKNQMPFFEWPAPVAEKTTVGNTLIDLISENGWGGAARWQLQAQQVAPTIVGGSKKHGGPDLGPTRAKKQWRELGVDGIGIANAPPASDFPTDGQPRLTIRMVARIQGFPDFWKFSGKKTAAYRQVGNAFPPPVAAAVGSSIAAALEGKYPTNRRARHTQLRLLEESIPYC
ncbi:MAG: DNA (cytosine-5-)-methyltransferase [Verrucomicrobia bacterium]|nr:MAG: DNA (cytosine-5-)-methyltransferase [Verrucomicrobiota bacterium]